MMGKPDDNMLSPEDKKSSNPFSSIKRALSGRRDKTRDTQQNVPDITNRRAASNPFADPPPAYSPTSAESPSSALAQGASSSSSVPPATTPSTIQHAYPMDLARAALNCESYEEQLEFLRYFDTVFLIDDSESMDERSYLREEIHIDQNGVERTSSVAINRWRETREALEKIVKTCMRYDDDGIDLHFLNYKNNDDDGDAEKGIPRFGFRNIKDMAKVRTIFANAEPFGWTPTAERLRDLLDPYLDLYERKLARTRDTMCMKPLNIIIITDGAPNNPEQLKDYIIRQARRLDSLKAPLHQVGIQFFQVGRDERATRHLQDLDDNLKGNIRGGKLRDMVDHCKPKTTLTEQLILKTVLGSVKKNLDRLPTEG
ncbi:hypothetical protein GGR57DRAFT_114714 [Xylariaceae sp. FL1272]|nr:hypothetical protein GGR57DRAFT_114714 [Xylariaceae sp. FL1272]